MTPILIVEAFLSGFIGSLQESYAWWHLNRQAARNRARPGAPKLGDLRQRIWHLWI